MSKKDIGSKYEATRLNIADRMPDPERSDEVEMMCLIRLINETNLAVYMRS